MIFFPIQKSPPLSGMPSGKFVCAILPIRKHSDQSPPPAACTAGLAAIRVRMAPGPGEAVAGGFPLTCAAGQAQAPSPTDKQVSGMPAIARAMLAV
jgi:hypothetical protein